MKNKIDDPAHEGEYGMTVTAFSENDTISPCECCGRAMDPNRKTDYLNGCDECGATTGLKTKK